MRELIPMDSYGVFADGHDTARANSLMVAEFFGKHHDKVCEILKTLTARLNLMPPTLALLNTRTAGDAGSGPMP